MKKSSFFSATAALLIFVALSNSSTAQPGYRSGSYAQSKGYGRENPLPPAPVIVIDGDGRKANFEGHNFDRYDVQQTLDRRQRKRLEKRYGYVPPLVIFVPDRFVNRYGDYIYNDRLVYHRGRDGFFHLDNRYYNDKWDDYSINNDRYGRNDRQWDDNRSHY